MNRDDAFGVFHQVVENRWNADAIIELAGAQARPIAGVLDTGIPEEILIAAGYHPMLLTGDLAVPPVTVEKYLDVSAPARVRYLYEALATGRHDAASVLCVAGGDRWLGETAGFFEAYAPVFGAPDIARTLYLERARGTFSAHRNYNRDGMVVFAAQLSEESPHPVTHATLREAISLVNRTRELLRQVENLRRGTQPRISGSDAAAITLSAMLMPKAEFNDILARALQTIENTDALVADADRPRVFLTGSAVDHPGFVELIEAAGATGIGEDTEFGLRYAHMPVREDIPDPYEALADRWTYKFPESWGFGRERRITQRVEMAVDAQPDAVIAVHILGDSSYGWDFPDQADALRAQGIAVLALPDTDYALTEPESVRERIVTFLAGLGTAASDVTATTEDNK